MLQDLYLQPHRARVCPLACSLLPRPPPSKASLLSATTGGTATSSPPGPVFKPLMLLL